MSENTHQIQSLLDSVSNIIQKHETQANYTGENYNIFSIMGMENDEEFTHSRIIGNLLNPKGKHGCGDFFLKTFVEKLNILFEENNLHDMKLEDFGPLVNERITERYAGEVNFTTISGGSIDLVIEDSKQILLIENKINAADQKYQLARYYNYAKTRGNKKIVMLYLTLEGKNLSDNEGNILIKEDKVYNIPSMVNLDENAIKLESLELKFPIDQNTFDEINIENKCFYTPISYKTFIKEWLEASFFFVDNRPMIYYPIKHYYNLIKKLTNQSIYKNMSTTIKNLFSKNTVYIRCIEEINNGFYEFTKEINDNFWKKLKQELNLDENFQNILEFKNCNIFYEVKTSEDGLYLGYLIKNKDDKDIKKTILKNLQNLIIEKYENVHKNDYYLFWINIKDYSKKDYMEIIEHDFFSYDKFNKLDKEVIIDLSNNMDSILGEVIEIIKDRIKEYNVFFNDVLTLSDILSNKN
jgi:hypothetical protein